MFIGIPKYKDDENFNEMLESLRNSTNQIEKIVIVESIDEGEEQHYEDTTGIEWFKIKNEGPLKAYNKLFEIAKERKEDLFLTQTDVYFPQCKKDWLGEIKEVAKYPNCGMITCWGGGGISGPDFINGFKWIGAWFVYIPYSVIEKCGAFDENIPLGYGVDIDYSYYVEQAGFRNCYINYWVQHMPDYKDNHKHEQIENFEELKKEAFRYMREKWKVGEYEEQEELNGYDYNQSIMGYDA